MVSLSIKKCSYSTKFDRNKNIRLCFYCVFFERISKLSYFDCLEKSVQFIEVTEFELPTGYLSFSHRENFTSKMQVIDVNDFFYK